MLWFESGSILTLEKSTGSRPSYRCYREQCCVLRDPDGVALLAVQ